jgi:hypothetical protein
MKNKAIQNTKKHFNSYGGEVRTKLSDGILPGAIVGLAIGLGLTFMWSSGDFSVPGAESAASIPIRYIFIIFASTIVGAAAGAVIGIGIPKIKLRPDQGLVKKWQPISVADEKNRPETVYIPKETRSDRQNNRENMEL